MTKAIVLISKPYIKYGMLFKQLIAIIFSVKSDCKDLYNKHHIEKIMFHNGVSESHLVFNKYQPECKSDVQKALKFRFTKLLNFWLFNSTNRIVILIRDTLGTQIEKKIARHDLFGFVFQRREHNYPLTTIPNYVEFTKRYLEFGISNNAICPQFSISQKEFDEIYSVAQDTRDAAWLSSIFNLYPTAWVFHCGFLRGIRQPLACSNYAYAEILLENESPAFEMLDCSYHVWYQLAIKFVNETFLDKIEKIEAKWCQDFPSPMFRVAVARRYIKQWNLQEIDKNAILSSRPFRHTVLSLLGMQYANEEQLVSIPTNLYWALYSYRRTRISYVTWRIVNPDNIRNFTEEFPDSDHGQLTTLKWFRLVEGEPIDWQPCYYFDLNRGDRNIVTTLMTLQLLPTLWRLLPNELIFEIIDCYMKSFSPNKPACRYPISFYR